MSTPLIVPYVRHPLSCALPTYPEAQLTELAQSIKRHGLRHKIVMCEGMILDGWNRLLACALAEFPPAFRDLKEDETAAFVVLANNIDRRDLSKSEKAFAVADIFFIVNGIWSNSSHAFAPEGSSAASLHWSKATIWKQTKVQLAARAGVKPRMMQDVLRIRARGEHCIIDAVRSGEISVEDASPLVSLDMDGQYGSLQNHCEGKAEQKAKRVETKREEAAARAELKRARADRSLPPPRDNASDAEAAPLTERSAPSSRLRAMMCEAEVNLNALCEALADNNLIVECKKDSAALAAACREYLTLMDDS